MNEKHLTQGPLAQVLERLDGVKARPGGRYEAPCPAHDYKEPSLGITEGDDGRVLLNCLAGCETEDVIAVIGLTMQDLFPARSSEGPRRPSRVWEIKDREGVLKGRHLRFDKGEDKECLWTRPNGQWGLSGTPLSGMPLYGSEEVPDWPERSRVVLVEGEPARDALAAVGIRSLGTVTGASTTPGPEALEVLRGHRVIMWADNDDAGREHMERIAKPLSDIASEMRWFTWEDAPDKGDAADYPAIITRDREGIRDLKHALSDAPIYFHHIHGGFDENKKATIIAYP